MNYINFLVYFTENNTTWNHRSSIIIYLFIYWRNKKYVAK